MRKLLLLPLFAVALLLTTCRKNATNEYPEFIGTWVNSFTTLKIDEDGYGTYHFDATSSAGRSTINATSDASGKIKIEDDIMIMGRGLFKMNFTIDAYPTEYEVNLNEFNTYMVLNGDTLYKTPYFEPFPGSFCNNGIQDHGEKGVDCGGQCDSCVTCFDGIKNQDETGVDCGGVCEPCEKGSCFDDFEVQNAFIENCSGSNHNDFSYSFLHADDYGSTFIVSASSGYWNLNVVFPGQPTESKVYDLIENYYAVDYFSGNRNEASLKFNHYFSGDRTCQENAGKLYVIVENGVVTLTFCEVLLIDQAQNCDQASGKLSWDL